MALLVVLVLMPLVLASPAARVQSQARILVDRAAAAPVGDLAHPLFRDGGPDPAAIRITPLGPRAIDAFATTGNRLVAPAARAPVASGAAAARARRAAIG